MSEAVSAAAPINRRMITISIMLATIIQALDGTIASVALPQMQGSLSASQDQITWVLTSFIVAAAIATPLNGWLCDLFRPEEGVWGAIEHCTDSDLAFQETITVFLQ